MKKCPNGHEVSDEAKFCPTCGAEVMVKSSELCPQCGTERKENQNFCPKCGAAFDASKVVEKNKSRRGFAIVSSLCLLALVIAGAVWYYLNHFQQDYSLENLAAVVVECDEVRNFHDGLAAIRKDNKWGYLDKEGKLVISYTFDDAYDFCEGYAKLQKGDKWGFIDKTGKEVIPCAYDETGDFHDGMALVKKNGKYEFIDKTSKQILPCNYDIVTDFSEGLAVVKKGDKWGYIDKKGKEVISCVYDGAEDFHDGLALVYKDEKYAFINKDGEEALALGDKNINVRGFYDGLALVESEKGDNLRYGFIDKKGKVVIPEIYYAIRGYYGEFQDGYAVVYKDGEGFGVIDKTNKVIIPFKDEYITFSEGLFCVCKNEKWGFYDTNGNCIISFIYDFANDFSEGLAAVKKDDIWGFVDKKGNSTFDVQNEETRKIVQVKIQEKEEIRKEEERRAEEERKRLEELAKPANVFYNLACQNKYMWTGPSVYGKLSRYNYTVCLYFYPSNKNSGEVHVIHEEGNGYSETYMSKVHYTVHDNIIVFTARYYSLWRKETETEDFIMEIRTNGTNNLALYRTNTESTQILEKMEKGKDYTQYYDIFW